MNLYVYILLQATQKTLSLTEKSWELAGLPVMQWCNVAEIQLQWFILVGFILSN